MLFSSNEFAEPCLVHYQQKEKKKRKEQIRNIINYNVNYISFKCPIVSAQWLKMEASSKNYELIPAKSISQLHKPVQHVFNKFYQ